MFRPRHSALCESLDATVHFYYKLLGKLPKNMKTDNLTPAARTWVQRRFGPVQ
jgi:hypothetical protein